MNRNTKNLRLDLPMKFHRGLRRLAGVHGSKKGVAMEIIMRQLIKDGLVRPSKSDLIMCREVTK